MKLSVLISFSGAGGVEKMVMNLVREFATLLDQLDLLVLRASGPHFQNIPDNVRVIRLKSSHTLTAIPELTRYLRSHRPDRLLVAKDRAARAAVFARLMARVDTKIVVRLGTNLSTALAHKNGVAAWLRTAPMRKIYRQVDHVVAVSEGVARDTLAITKIEEEKVSVIRNPVITADFYRKKTGDEAPHPWLRQKTVPVFMGIGRLSVQKDFTSLIHAFHKLSQHIDARLIILGDGKKREELEGLISTLSLNDAVLMPGFQANLVAWLAHADVFVLSSRWEGSPNALTEALALGIRCVSTRCPSGPDEVLQNGRYGPLVEVGDAEGLATAMRDVLNDPKDKATLQEAVQEYRSDISAKRYLELLRAS